MTVHPITNSSLCQSITYTANAELTGPFQVSPPIVFARNFLYSLSVGRGLKISLIVTRNVPSPPITVFFVFQFHNVPFFYYRLLSFLLRFPFDSSIIALLWTGNRTRSNSGEENMVKTICLLSIKHHPPSPQSTIFIERIIEKIRLFFLCRSITQKK